jgi:hypothetical protein
MSHEEKRQLLIELREMGMDERSVQAILRTELRNEKYEYKDSNKAVK